MVERRIELLSKLTAEIILPSRARSSHLSSQNQTADKDVEKQNFQAAEKVLVGVWNDSMIETLREKCPITEFFLVRIFLYSVWIQENTNQKNLHAVKVITKLQITSSTGTAKTTDCDRKIGKVNSTTREAVWIYNAD